MAIGPLFSAHDYRPKNADAVASLLTLLADISNHLRRSRAQKTDRRATRCIDFLNPAFDAK